MGGGGTVHPLRYNSVVSRWLFLAVALLQATAPKAPADPFATAKPAELNAYQVVLETTKGNITLGFMAEKAPDTVRYFLQLASAEVFDATIFHRVIPKGFIQTGAPFFRQLPLSGRQRRLLRKIKPEFNDVKSALGIVMMAREDDPNVPESSFFICTGSDKNLDGKYTAFARVVAGMPVVRAIEAAPATLERPKEKIILIQVKVSKKK